MQNTVKFAGTSTFVTQIVQGSFHYSASVSNPGELRLGGIYSASIEFDYYTSNGITVNVGDTLNYTRKFLGVNTSFEEASGSVIQNKGNFNVTSVENRGETCHVIAYDDIIKLDVSFSARLKQLESSFPMSLHDLLDEVIAVSGVPTSIHELQVPISQFWAQKIMYFYSDSITCRNIYEWIAELRGFPLALDTSVTPNKIANRPFAWNRQVATSWPTAGAYIICPDDGTYTVPYDPASTVQAIDVWYKENGLSIGKPITSYDGVEIVWPDGAIIGHYYGVQTPTKIYRVKNNILFNYILLDGTQENPNSIAHNIYNCLADLATCVSGTVALFPFRYPFTASAFVGIVDTQGNQYKLPVMREDFTDNGVIIEAFANDYDNTSVSNSSDTQENKTVSLDVRVTALESQKIDGYTLVNFASASAGTISTYNSRSFSDYIWLVAEWVVNSSIRATMMFRRVDFENAPYVSLFYVDSANTQRWCELSYVDDTTLSITASSNASGNIALFGLAIVNSVPIYIPSVEYLTTANGDRLTTVDGDYLTL